MTTSENNDDASFDAGHRVGEDEIERDGKSYRVSTVWLAPVSHGFETMVFEIDPAVGLVWRDLYCDRYDTREEAVSGHARTVAEWQPTSAKVKA